MMVDMNLIPLKTNNLDYEPIGVDLQNIDMENNLINATEEEKFNKSDTANEFERYDDEYQSQNVMNN